MTAILVILVTGGIPYSIAGRSTELLHINGSRLCSLPNLPTIRYGHSQTRVTLCGDGYGGKSRTTCHTLTSSGSWVKSHNLNQRRLYHSVWSSPRGIMLLGGANTYSAGTTTEILLENGRTTPGFRLTSMARLSILISNISKINVSN